MANPLRDGDPATIGPYRLRARLGGGGMGQVFLGRSPGGHTVAVKIVRPELADDSAFRRRFAAARRVGGFYTAPVVDADPDADPPWLATAYIPGPSLHQAVEDHGPLPLASVAVLGAGLAEGLMAVHACQVVHRDLKPANVILAADGPRLIDFGIARALDATSHTQTSTVLGTAAFMSPEQAMAQRVGPASDVFSLGCVLAFAATGRSPFGEGPAHAVVFRVVHAAPDLTGLPDPLSGVVAACLAKTPDARPGLEELLGALAPPGPARPAGRWLPEALTEVITRRTSTVATLVATTQNRASGRAEDGRGRPAEGGVEPGAAGLLVGNIGPERLQVLIDGAAVGGVAPGQSESFRLPPGTRFVQARVAGRDSAVRRIAPRAGATARMAFDIPRRSDPVPEPVQEVTFVESRGSSFALWAAVGIVFVAVLIAIIVVAIGATTFVETGIPFAETEWEDLAPFAWVLLVFAVLLGLGGLIFPAILTLGPDGVVFPILGGGKKKLGWDAIEQIGVIGDGPGARIVLWQRKGGPQVAGTNFQDGTVACLAKRIGARSPRDLERLRAALRWFAGDAYVEQSP